MSKIVIYATKYGSSEKYAKEIAKKLSCQAYSFEKVKDINNYDTIVYVGAIFAGGMVGLGKTIKSIDDIDKKKVIIASVGLSDPSDQRNTANIKKGIARSISAETFTKVRVFHLRGGIDYEKLSILHKFMMKMVYYKAITLKESEKTDEVSVFVKTYGKKVDFVDFDTLKPLLEVAK